LRILLPRTGVVLISYGVKMWRSACHSGTSSLSELGTWSRLLAWCGKSLEELPRLALFTPHLWNPFLPHVVFGFVLFCLVLCSSLALDLRCLFVVRKLDLVLINFATEMTRFIAQLFTSTQNLTCLLLQV